MQTSSLDIFNNAHGLLAQRQLKQQKDKLTEELTEAREQRLVAEIKRETMEQILSFANRIVSGNSPEEAKPEKTDTKNPA